jgi:hypothetical protein
MFIQWSLVHSDTWVSKKIFWINESDEIDFHVHCILFPKNNSVENEASGLTRLYCTCNMLLNSQIQFKNKIRSKCQNFYDCISVQKYFFLSLQGSDISNLIGQYMQVINRHKKRPNDKMSLQRYH